jgi:hypothetical protein
MGERRQQHNLIHLFTLMFTLTKDLEDLSDDELLEALRTSGVDPEKEASDIRQLFSSTIRQMRETGEERVTSSDFPLFDLPEAPEERRALLNEIMSSYRDATNLSDETVVTLLCTFKFLDATKNLRSPDRPETRA